MPQPAARQGDTVTGVDIHIVMLPSPGGPVPTPLPHPFNGRLVSGLSADVQINGQAAATHGSTAQNSPPHIPSGGPFQRPPSNSGKVFVSRPATVLVNNLPLAVLGDPVMTCNDPTDAPTCTIATGSPDVLVS
jgi:uncharacterized Zn-binding protein involved in type VI secretion